MWEIRYDKTLLSVKEEIFLRISNILSRPTAIKQFILKHAAQYACKYSYPEYEYLTRFWFDLSAATSRSSCEFCWAADLNVNMCFQVICQLQNSCITSEFSSKLTENHVTVPGGGPTCSRSCAELISDICRSHLKPSKPWEQRRYRPEHPTDNYVSSNFSYWDYWKCQPWLPVTVLQDKGPNYLT